MPIRNEAGLVCPPSQDWALLAAGAIHGERAQTLLAHVAECEDCGLTLRLATESMDAEPVTLAAPAGLARQLASHVTAEPKVVEMPKRRVWAVAAMIAAAVTLVVGGLVWRPGADAPSTEALLAQAYSERRPFDFRIGEAEFAPVRVVRSSAVSRPKALLDAEVRLSAARATDLLSLQMKARAQMLEFEPEFAVATLKEALSRDPKNAGLLADLGSAYAQSGDWAHAHEALTAALDLQPSYAVALFNRALVNARRNARMEALADWDRYLAIDGTSAWAHEAREHRQALDHPASN